MRERNLTSTTDDLDTLWSQLDKVRSTSKTVTVPKAALTAVLIDHSAMSAALFGHKHRSAA